MQRVTYSQVFPTVVFAKGIYYNTFIDKIGGSYSYGFHGLFVEPDGNLLVQDIKVAPLISYLSFMHKIIYGQDNYLVAW